ncbi:hypothetical protein KSS94_14015 [Pseudomonas fakonensis]|uniref:YcxB-like protein domain-containing protein n=1 Tax=Pseudomonas fakonensis TaxID=2842355 RepID=A0ABX8MZK0_9PSED|nr:hypothetical protein [Pseudomonas fakonensis]QXH49080.1 hypothetical protein KSS94_14015 [Pseudomonas fakonensis]
MELHYSITPAHTEIRVAKKLAKEMAWEDRMHERVRRWQLRLTPAFQLLTLPFGATVVYLFLPYVGKLEKVIAIVIATLLFIPYWWCFCLRRARHALANPKPRRLRRINERLAESAIRRMLVLHEGRYRLTFDDQGFTLTPPPRVRAGGLRWDEITHIRECADFYAISSAALERKKRAYRIPRHSDLMPAEQYLQGLATFLSKCPVKPEVN